MLAVQIALVVGPDATGHDKVPPPARQAADFSNTEALGKVLYTQHVYAFELAAVILLVAIIAAIALTMRRRQTKAQVPSDQVAVRREDRVRLVKMRSEGSTREGSQ